LVRVKVKAVKIGNSVRVAIPRDVLDASGVKEGDILSIDYDEKSGLITIRKEITE
jgi:antitoxin component of MazEF toxin-antitoxin module